MKNTCVSVKISHDCLVQISKLIFAYKNDYILWLQSRHTSEAHVLAESINLQAFWYKISQKILTINVHPKNAQKTRSFQLDINQWLTFERFFQASTRHKPLNEVLLSVYCTEINEHIHQQAHLKTTSFTFAN